MTAATIQQAILLGVCSQDLSFRRPFQLTAQRDDHGVSGLLAYFEASFTGRGHIQDPVTLSTHPLAPATAWLQTIFTFPRVLKLQKGQIMGGSLSCNARGSPVGRLLDVDVEVVFEGKHARVAYQMKRTMDRL